jgi:hypothetical protein
MLILIGHSGMLTIFIVGNFITLPVSKFDHKQQTMKQVPITIKDILESFPKKQNLTYFLTKAEKPCYFNIMTLVRFQLETIEKRGGDYYAMLQAIIDYLETPAFYMVALQHETGVSNDIYNIIRDYCIDTMESAAEAPTMNGTA